jgi:predicted O-linked N-acetylglucosamine transferase (SPINDLY family)
VPYGSGDNLLNHLYAMNPARVQQLLQQGLAHHQAGRLKEAESVYRQARALTTRSFEIMNLSGMLAYQQSRYGDAVNLLRSAVPLAPRSSLAACRMQLGAALAAAAKHNEAIIQLRTSLQLDATNAETWNSLGFSLRVLGQFAEAITAYEKAIELKPDYFDAIDRLGSVIADTRGLPAGIPYFRRALAINPNYGISWGNLGLSLSDNDEHTAALEAFDRALKLDPSLVKVHVGRAVSLQRTYRIEEAAAEFAAAINQLPSLLDAHTGRLLTLNYVSGKTRQEIFNEHIAFGQAVNHTLRDRKPVTFAKGQNPHRRLRVAFISQDFRKHSVAYFIEPILRHFDRSRFELVLYHDHFQVDAISDRLRGKADLWRNFVGQTHDQVEQVIRADAPDILIDLAGHTGISRLPVFARRVAPVQINYLGYPNTTGLHEMDYRFVDAITDPGPEDEQFHTEKLIRFSPCAWTYEPPASAPEPTMPAPGRITFGSFNNFAKVSTATLDLWRRVLTAVPESRLVLKGLLLNDPALSAMVEQKLKTLAIDRSRIELLGRAADLADHLRLYSSIDVALDTFPYNGTTTTCEALWMGTPVVTLYGDRHAARVSSSLLTAAGHPELIAHSEDEYVRIAAELANDTARRTTLRHSLREDLRRGPLLDHTGQAERFATALQNCWEARSR